MSNAIVESAALPLAKSLRGNRCAAQHFGSWAIEPKWFNAAVQSIRAGTWKPEPSADWDDDEDDDVEDDGPSYELVNGIALIHINGQMTKRGSSFGGCSTVRVRQQLREAAADYMVKAVLLVICTPGGSVAGTSDLAAEIRATRAKKPVYGYCEDMCCSAGYWAVSQCQYIWAGVTALVGCIGTYTVLEDDTGWQEQLGIKWRVVSTGKYKGLGADGKVSDELVADVQREIDELNAPFLADVAAGRAGKIADVVAIADGRAHVGQQAKQLGLIDAVSTLDEAVAAISEEVGTMPITGSQFAEYAAANPSAAEVQALITQGKEQALKSPANASDLKALIPGDADFALSQLEAGASLATAATAGCKRLTEQLATVKSDLAAAKTAQTTEIAALKEAHAKEIERVKLELGGQGAIGTGNATRKAPAADAKTEEEFAKIADPKERAKAEWAANFGDCKTAFTDEPTYVGFRSVELRNGVTFHKPANG